MSDLLIRGMEMPKDDMKNIMILSDGRVFQFSGYGNPKPLGTAVPVPPHGRLGDLDALQKLFLEKAKENKGVGGAMVAMAALCIANASTIIPAEEGET